MKEAPREHIEAKIINFLRDLDAPSHASQIAVQIQETREDTLRAIQRLVKDRTIKGKQDFSLFSSTGEIVAYTLADPLLQPALMPGAIPPPSTPPTRRVRR
jgi:predicted transcriptional regulator